MKQMMDYTIAENTMIARATYKMRLLGDSSWVAAPGQFINLKIAGCYLRRPISISTWEAGELTIVYKVAGKGTSILAQMEVGSQLNALVNLGNGFRLDVKETKVVLIGGGVGVPPLLGLCREWHKRGKDIHVLLGFQTKEDVFYEDAFQQFACKVDICTDDGSYGHAGRVTELLEELGLTNQYYATCGPKAMLRAVAACSHAKGQISLEERMGCGYGACLACTCQTKSGYARICKEGPVLDSEEILWNDCK